MLVLSRTQGESVFIDGRKIQVMVLSVDGARVRIGVKAPEGVPVHREEVLKVIERQEKSSASTST
ncbi:carbon storage regulator [Candidatus Kaiserbacteria bacterium]|nr:carbon storage regulator [Candidatus Kaiserbacteria bacterium]